ncbi:hypothetical protein [uncultured Desulfobulbus sp.]|uniref:hypothetical protein n=1 Tax=uncultured Desulfobulbus sp. TaxID=239745 RepID=UPI0029C6C793|nr:hypothetical protein [uncultured Desulfobulbus sp.]
MSISHNEAPDYDRLESVATTSRRSMVLGSIVLVIVIGYMSYRIMIDMVLPHIDNPFNFVGALGVIVIAAPALLGVIFMIGMFRTDNWRTTKDYIVKFKLFSEERIFWEAITNVETHIIDSKTGKILPDVDVDDDKYGRDFVITLWDGDRSLKVEGRNPHLIASILMHLNRYGMGRSIAIPRAALELLQPPSTREIPEINWHLKNIPLWRRYGVIILLLGILALLAFTIFADTGTRHLVWRILVPLYFGVYLIYHIYQEIFTAFRLKIELDRFTARTIFGEKAVAWNKVTDAKWDSLAYKNEGPSCRYVDAPSKLVLRLCMGWMESIYIPWDPKDEESTQLIRAIMDRLQQLPKPIVLLSPHSKLDNVIIDNR